MKQSRRLLTLVAVGALGAATWGVGSSLVQDVRFARAEAEVADARKVLATAGDMSDVYKAVNHAMENSVVHITVSKVMHNNAGQVNPQDLFKFFGPGGQMPGMPGQPQDPNDTPDDQQAPGDNNGGGDDDQPQPFATGSGVVMDSSNGEAWILTNNHVVGEASKVDITLNDGRKIENATIVATDPKTDLAVVKIKADHVIAAKWGDSDSLEKGDIVIAFGSPFGFIGSMSHGIVSALNRDRVDIINPRANGGFAYENFIQVDAAINPGNSGGPLCNTHGEVVGINTAIASRSGSFSGIGFAIPSSEAKGVYESLKTNGKVVRGYLGVGIIDIHSDDPNTKTALDMTGFKGENGILVQQVMANSPALNVLQLNDIITQLDGKDLKSMTEFRTKIASMTPDTKVTLTVWRDGKTQPVEIKLGTQPDNVALNNAQPKPGNQQQPLQLNTLGLTVATPTADDLEAAGLPGESKGVIVKQVRPNSFAFAMGIKPGDLITRIGQTSIASVDEAKAALAKADPKKPIRIDLLNKQGAKMLLIPRRGINR